MFFMPDLTSKNSSIALLSGFSILFLVTALATSALSVNYPQLGSVAADIWKTFTMTYGALFIGINIAPKQ